MDANHSDHMLRGSTDGLLLFLINEEEQSYGYQIIKGIEKRSRGYLRFKEGTIYPALHKLENQDLIHGEWSELPSGQQRRCYRITEKGRNVLGERLQAWEGFFERRQPHLWSFESVAQVGQEDVATGWVLSA